MITREQADGFIAFMAAKRIKCEFVDPDLKDGAIISTQPGHMYAFCAALGFKAPSYAINKNQIFVTSFKIKSCAEGYYKWKVKQDAEALAASDKPSE